MSIKKCCVFGIRQSTEFCTSLTIAALIDYALTYILSLLGCTYLFGLTITCFIILSIVISIILSLDQAVAIVVYIVVCFVLNIEVNKITHEEAFDKKTGELRMGFYCCNVKYLTGAYTILDKWKQDLNCCDNKESNQLMMHKNSNGLFQVACFERLNFYADMRIFTFGASCLFTFLFLRWIRNYVEARFETNQEARTISENYELTVIIPIDKTEEVL